MVKFVASYSQGKAALAIYTATKDVFLTNRMEHISFIINSIFSLLSMVRVAKHLKGDFFMILS